MIDAGVPGIRNNVAVINPPLTLPTYIDTNSTNACSPLMVKVKGNDNAINIAPVNPGIAPTVTPNVDPTQTSNNELGVASNRTTGGCKTPKI